MSMISVEVLGVLAREACVRKYQCVNSDVWWSRVNHTHDGWFSLNNNYRGNANFGRNPLKERPQLQVFTDMTEFVIYRLR